MRNAAVAIALLLTGCIDSVVSQSPIGGPKLEERRLGSIHTSYCFTCLPGFDGKMNCGMKLSYACPCSYQAKVSVQTIRRRHESGKESIGERVTEIARLGACR